MLVNGRVSHKELYSHNQGEVVQGPEGQRKVIVKIWICAFANCFSLYQLVFILYSSVLLKVF